MLRRLTAASRARSSRLRDRGPLLCMPHARPLGEGMHELRFTCEGTARRITYYFDRERMVVTLTTFRKQRQNERREITRARRSMAADQQARRS